MNSFVKKYAGIALASTVVIGGIASAAITPIPTISNTFAVAGQKIFSADLNKLAEALNILDTRTQKIIKWEEISITDTNLFDPYSDYKAIFQDGLTERSISFSYVQQEGMVDVFGFSPSANNSVVIMNLEAINKQQIKEKYYNSTGLQQESSKTVIHLYKKSQQ